MEQQHDVTKLSPVEYGKLRNIAPQLVYYHLREEHIAWDRCECGRKVINIEEADKYLKKGPYSESSNEATSDKPEEA